MKLVYIEWEDAQSQNGWHTREEVKEFIEKPIIVNQIGWIFEETRRYIVLIARHAPGGLFTNDDDDSFGNLQRIPKTWIKKRIDLTEYIV